jgi:hypothetical protein
MAAFTSGTPITQTALIANGASLSSVVELGAGKLVAIQMPAAWTAAALTFSASIDGTNYFDVYDGSTERNYSVDASRMLILQMADWIGIKFLKIRSGTSGTPVSQGADRTLTLLVQP